MTTMYFDLIMETVHRYNDYDRDWKEKYIYNSKYLLKLIFYVVLFIDLLYFYLLFPKTALRFARVLRPLCILFYSYDLRRNFKSIIYSFKEIIQLFLFFFCMTFIWAFFATRFVGNLDDEIEYDVYS